MHANANGITDDNRQPALMLSMTGSRIREIFNNLANTGEDEDFKTAHEKLTAYFAP